MNRRAKFDAASCILARDIRNRRNKPTKNYEKYFYIHVSCLTVYVYYVYFAYDFLNNNNIPTPCLSACVDINYERSRYDFNSTLLPIPASLQAATRRELAEKNEQTC